MLGIICNSFFNFVFGCIFCVFIETQLKNFCKEETENIYKLLCKVQAIVFYIASFNFVVFGVLGIIKLCNN